MKAKSPFSNMGTQRLIVSAEELALSQDKLCSAATEDSQWWHHFVLASLIRELAERLSNDERIIAFGDSKKG